MNRVAVLKGTLATPGKPKKWRPGDVKADFELLEPRGNGYWLCRCKCGTEVVTLLGKEATCCIACKPSKFKFNAGQVVGKLTLVESVGRGRWICDCACGQRIKTCPGAHSSCNRCRRFRGKRPGGKQDRVLPDTGIVSKDPEENRLKGNYRSAFYNARNKNIPFALTIAEYREVISRPCEYCKAALPRTGSGLDRVVSSGGYEKDNVVSCCTICNSVKSDRFRFREMKVIGPFIRRLLNARPSPLQGLQPSQKTA